LALGHQLGPNLEERNENARDYEEEGMYELDIEEIVHSFKVL